MSNSDERRWQQRLDNFGTALAQLTNACERERYDDLERAGLINPDPAIVGAGLVREGGRSRAVEALTIVRS